MTKTAVILATYNGAEFIESQLASIKAQTRPTDYVLVRDDRSTDETANIVNAYIVKNNLVNWQIVVNEKNQGWRLNFRQLMTDALATDADYIFFSDHDDNWAPQKIERQLACFEQVPNADLISSDYVIKIIGEGKLSGGIPYEFPKNETLSRYPFDMKKNSIFRLGWTNVITRNFAQKIIDIWQEEISDVSHDTLVSMIASNAETGYNLNEELGIHVRHGGNSSGTGYLSLSSPHSQHLAELKRDMHYFQLTYDFAQKNQTIHKVEAEKMMEFYEKRFKNARERRFFATVLQAIRDRRLYFDIKGPIRDIIFIFKK